MSDKIKEIAEESLNTISVNEKVGNLIADICENHGDVPADEVMAAFQMGAAQIALAFEKEEGEVVSSQQLLWHRVKASMIENGTYGCAVKGTLADLTKN